ncbi:hypothetical protein [Konateibacter massiliensis]|uniref:hypothetical protein n=1 Tax=Konateibacter massiliensis TaxID=2002841 RepID=UPI000C1461E7|nr:hypothetical protein [Konateibacter massiliensis]
MFDKKGRFIIEDYNRQSTFSSFLPGISGLEGIPIWCFYVNRGQAIASFGTEDKNHSIMEFYPAHQAYQLAKTMGFRTFLKVDGQFYEPFCSDEKKTRMYIGMNELEIEEWHEELGIQVNVLYYTLPNEKLGGLVRKVTIKNKRDAERKIDVLDGMPAVIPYGIELGALKEMAQTMKAWMQVEDTDEKLPYYRVRYSTKDSAKVSKIEEGNYYISMTGKGERLPILADPQIIFDYDTSCQKPVGFLNNSIGELLQKKQMVQNQVPSGFCAYEGELKEKEETSLYSVIGQAASKKIYQEFAERSKEQNYFVRKYEEAKALTMDVSKGMEAKTGNRIFDEYCRQTYVDNVLRGGYPVTLGNNHIFYVYGRKHGDIERDYNFFRMLPEYYSQGNGNFRDVNQNRRCDVLFSPHVRDYNIKLFYNLIQLDGYNPLVVKQVSYETKNLEQVLSCVKEDDRKRVTKFLEKEFSPGELLGFLGRENITTTLPKEEFLGKVIDHAEQKLNADFGEGYWTDHWTYNLDLIEAYLKVFPEEERRLLLEDASYTYYEARAVVLPREQRYVVTEDGVRQYNCVDEEIKAEVTYHEVRDRFGEGKIYHSNLLTKLLVMIQNKFATLDMFGMGIEMEGGKPGWYDALNGLPGMFGSSMAETYELHRLLKYVQKTVNAYQAKAEVFNELYDFIIDTDNALKTYRRCQETKFWVWNKLNEAKETYRQKTIWGIEGSCKILEYDELAALLQNYMDYVEEGIEEAVNGIHGICPTYFSYELIDYEIVENMVVPKRFEQREMPLFLEGAVRYFKFLPSANKKRKLYDEVKKSGLYDNKLQMYKVNASLANASFEIGRAKAFSAGWLENESIWLHMEYKYLLQLLKNGLYKEFYEDFHKACIPFLDYKMYGRSLLENSSFLASSANSNAQLHGKGFVARLSGSTAEFLEIWQLMMFGENPFHFEKEELTCILQPALPSYLIAENNTVEAIFLGNTRVIYQISEKKDLIPSNYTVAKITAEHMDGRIEQFKNKVEGETVHLLRNGKIKQIVCEIQVKQPL